MTERHLEVRANKTVIITVSAGADVEEIVARSPLDRGLQQAINLSLVKEE